MILSAQHKFLYVAIPKTATKPVRELLQGVFKGYNVGRWHGSSWPVADDYLAWAVVRDPYARLLSWWRAVVRNNVQGRSPPQPPELPVPCGTFAEFLRFMIANRDGHDLIEAQRDQRQPQHVFMNRQPCTAQVRLEHFTEDLATLPFAQSEHLWLGNRQNASDSSNKPLAEWYDDESLALAVDYGVKHECRALGYPEELT